MLVGVLMVGGVITTAVVLSQRALEANAGPCGNRQGAHLQATIRDDKVMPATIHASLCDQLTITNNDKRTREVAFGQHEHHEAYDGITEKILNKGQSMTVLLNQVGSFRFHDHEDDTVQAFFTVRAL